MEPLKRSLMAPSGNDYRPLGHMPGYTAGTPIKKNYDEYTFPLENGSVPVRGAVYGVAWSEPAKAPEREIRAHEIPENDRQALDDLHAQILLDVRSNINQITARLEDQGKTIWLYVNRAMHMTQVEAGVAALSHLPGWPPRPLHIGMLANATGRSKLRLVSMTWVVMGASPASVVCREASLVGLLQIGRLDDHNSRDSGSLLCGL